MDYATICRSFKSRIRLYPTLLRRALVIRYLAHVSGSSATIPGTLLDLPPDWRMDLSDPEKATDSSKQKQKESPMEHGIIAWLVIGAIAGFLAGKIVEGSGFGLIVDIIVGIVGAVIGGYLADAMGIAVSGGIIVSIIVAVIGAAVLLVVLRLVKRVM